MRGPGVPARRPPRRGGGDARILARRRSRLLQAATRDLVALRAVRERPIRGQEVLSRRGLALAGRLRAETPEKRRPSSLRPPELPCDLGCANGHHIPSSSLRFRQVVFYPEIVDGLWVKKRNDTEGV